MIKKTNEQRQKSPRGKKTQNQESVPEVQEPVGSPIVPQARTLPSWEDLPDFGLYMDQVLSLMERYLGDPTLTGEKPLTASMVNNYVKTGVIPAPEKKKYTRVHLASLIVVSTLKTVLPLTIIQDTLKHGMTHSTPETFYNTFRTHFEVSEQQALENLKQEAAPTDPQTITLSAALNAQAHRHIALSLHNTT